MDKQRLTQILETLKNGELSVDEAAGKLTHVVNEDLDFANIDHHRSLRKGFPEVIFGEGKTSEQIIGIMERMITQENVILTTRVDEEKAQRVLAAIPACRYEMDARMLIWAPSDPEPTGHGTVLVLSAGTSDIPVAREALLTARYMGNRVQSIFDVGVAGIHRLMRHREAMEKATVIIVVAGMEGALPSVVAGMVKAPVIAVPTSVGYGVSFGGMTALFGMLSSCSSNVAAVNIDNGFGAGYMASAINHIPLPAS
ncbi:nickel pincer cofactor biosynthesis protein LarB [Desulfoluna butyratoxydans]|uniref:Air carboxylase n=1 Tax=Desulfoluna butyratoxydans TaxID=231438 RepID=A0A4V6ILL1_9BACT|nr:nickel pincer cofactor biosynthesis protein LarB [Desulfoluna butyratoxydans]VFQ45518.1 air carboxylase [Desulfoluna butyratoxydans]